MKLGEFLDERGVSIYALQKKTEELGSRVSYQALHALANTERPSRVSLDVLDAVIVSLRELTGEKVELEDLLEYEG